MVMVYHCFTHIISIYWLSKMRTYHFYPLKVLVLLASGVNTILVIPDGCLTVAGRLQAFFLLVAGISTFNQEGMTNTDKQCLKDFYPS